eukprot:jgi/Chlat1/2898/Chrsp2S04661
MSFVVMAKRDVQGLSSRAAEHRTKIGRSLLARDSGAGRSAKARVRPGSSPSLASSASSFSSSVLMALVAATAASVACAVAAVALVHRLQQ